MKRRDPELAGSEDRPMKIAKLGAAMLLGGIAAGLAGTAAMSLSQGIEMKITGRKPSKTPAEAVCLALGIEARTEVEEHRLAEQAHWAYGAMWGFGHTILPAIREPARSLLYFATVWSSGAALLTATHPSPPPTRWKVKSLTIDLLHHAIFTVAGSLAYHAVTSRAVLRKFSRSARK